MSSSEPTPPPRNAVMQPLNQIQQQIAACYTFFRQTVVHDKILSHLSPKHLKPLTDITAAINIRTEKKGFDLQCEDVIVIGLSLMAAPMSYVTFFRTSLGFLAAEIYFTFIYPFTISLGHLELKSHDKIPYCLAYWILLSFILILEPLLGIKSYLPQTYLPIKCLVCFLLLNPKTEFMSIFYKKVVEEFILKEKMGLEGNVLKPAKNVEQAADTLQKNAKKEGNPTEKDEDIVQKSEVSIDERPKSAQDNMHALTAE